MSIICMCFVDDQSFSGVEKIISLQYLPPDFLFPFGFADVIAANDRLFSAADAADSIGRSGTLPTSVGKGGRHHTKLRCCMQR